MSEWMLVFLNYFLGFQRMRALEDTLKNSFWGIHITCTLM